ncbi:MAG: MarR family winged helix-turn-helix transcriptional regulator [Pseudomonadales bacterium]
MSTQSKNSRQNERHQLLGTLIHEVSLMNAKLFKRRMKEVGLTRTQWHVLYLLYREGQLSQTAIANSLMLAKPPLGKVVDRLEEGGWVERCADANDKRAKLVCLTTKIEPMLGLLEKVVEEIGGVATVGMTGEEQTTLFRLLKVAHTNLVEAEQLV